MPHPIPSSSPSSLPIEQQCWPTEDLQHLGACPACNGIHRTLEHDELVDKVFRCAPGAWRLWRCADCGVAYLDPRPSPTSIYIAYDTYYTHAPFVPKRSYQDLSQLRRVRRRMVNGYTNWRFSTKETPSWRIGLLLRWVLPFRRRIEHEYRNLPQNVPANGRVLDIGCASGAFLRTAKSCGWQVMGVDPDPKSAASACQMDIDVRQGGLELFIGQSEQFDIITICHVIEHVHDPRRTLEDIHRLLKPGGMLWLETPNLDSIGHRIYGKHWLGLDPPRHLCLFSYASLRNALSNAGFNAIRSLTGPSPLSGIVAASSAIKQDLPYGTPIKSSPIARSFWYLVSLVQKVSPGKREFLLVTARK